MALHQNLFKLVSVMGDQGVHPGDILVEVKTATLSAGTIEVPTVFKNGNILAVIAVQNAEAGVNNNESFTSDGVVTAGAVTVSGKTGSDEAVTVFIVGRMDF